MKAKASRCAFFTLAAYERTREKRVHKLVTYGMLAIPETCVYPIVITRDERSDDENPTTKLFVEYHEYTVIGTYDDVATELKKIGV